MFDKLWHLKNCNLFQRLEPAELRSLEASSRIRVLPPKSPIYLPVDEADAVLLLTAGRAKICSLTADGKQAILAFIEPGELFGELSLVASGARDEYAEAVERSTIVAIPSREIERLMRQHADFSLGVTRLVGLRRQRIERRLKSLLFRSNRQRLAHLLVELGERHGHATPEGLRIGIRLSHQDLADTIGSSRESVTILLGEFAQAGLVLIRRRTLVISNFAKLMKIITAETPAAVHRPATGRPNVRSAQRE